MPASRLSVSDPKIYITYHKSSHVVASGDTLLPIQVGQGPALPGIHLRDNVGVNISQSNSSYCELTALYWIWKSAPTSATHLGLLHYRRFFDFYTVAKPHSAHSLDCWGVHCEPAFTHDFQKRYGLIDTSIRSVCSESDIIVPKPWNVRDAGFANLREHYLKAPFHNASDLAVCEKVLCHRHPELADLWFSVMEGRVGYFNNMFVLRSDLLDDYCRWLFPLLSEIELRIPLHTYDFQAKRVMGYLSERLFNVWIADQRAKHPSLRVFELDRIFVEDTSPKIWDPPLPCVGPGQQLLSVVIASDDNYVPHLGALIASIVDNISPDRLLDLLVLDGGISSANRVLLRRLVSGQSAQLRFVPMQAEFNNYFVHMHFSRTTFYRLVLENLLPTRSRIIYVDCDTIVLGDLAALWDLDLQGKPVAAVPDLIMQHFCHANVLSADFTGSLPAKDYLRQYLGLNHDTHDRYFQAGVLVMDLERMRELSLAESMVSDLTRRRYWFLDQDVLNKYYAANYLPLEACWNYVNCGADIVESLSDSDRESLVQASNAIQIVHYAGYEAKPWVNRHACLAHHYFFYLRRTFWYEQVMEALGPSVPGLVQASRPSIRAYCVTRLRLQWRHLPYRLRRVLNPLAYRLIRLVRQPGS